MRSPQGPAFKIRWRERQPDGRIKQRSELLYGLTSKKEARSVVGERIKAASTQSTQSGLTLRVFIERYWWPYVDRKHLKPSTRKGYECLLNSHILPTLGELRLIDVTPLHIEALLQKEAESELSPTTVRNVIVVLQGIFALAVDDDLIDRSPIHRKHKPTAAKSSKDPWTPEQVRKIIDAVPSEYRALFFTVALTGVRLGELLGLQWKHVDFERRSLRVEQSNWYGQLVSPKTSASARTLLIGETLLAVLNEHRARAQRVGPDDFLFCKQDGSALNADVLRKDVLYPTLDRLNILRPKRGAGFHAFRHSAASLVNAETGNLKLAQKLLGHSEISTTADVYTHTTSESEREAALAIERAVFGDLFPSCSPQGTRSGTQDLEARSARA
jgi:integrase